MRAVNLIPSEQRSGGSVGARSDGGVFIVLGLLAGLALLVLLYGVARHQAASSRAEVSSLSTQVQRAQAQAAQLAPYTSFVAMHEQRQQALAQLVAARFDWADVMHELGRVLPLDTSLNSVQGTVGSTTGTTTGGAVTASATAAGASSVSSATPPGSTPTFTITGCAINQSTVAQTLVRLRLISGVSNVELQSSTKAGGSSSNGGCPASDPAFTVQVTFQPLPSAPPTDATPAQTTPAAASGEQGAHKATVSSNAATGALR